jgi:hypothetical protein
MVKLAKNWVAKCQKIQKNERVFLLHQSLIFWVVAQVIKNNGVQIKFIEDLVLYACKGYETI